MPALPVIDVDSPKTAAGQGLASATCSPSVAVLFALGYHPSLLPRHRGRDAIEWAIRMGDRVTGGSLYWLNDTVDGGPVAAQNWCFIRPGDTAKQLWARELFPMGLRLFDQALSHLEAGVVVAQPQDKTLASWEPALGNVPPLWRPDVPMLGTSRFKFVPSLRDIRDQPEAAKSSWPHDSSASV